MGSRRASAATGWWFAGLLALAAGGPAGAAEERPAGGGRFGRIVHADVVALDQCLVYNRFGTTRPDGMVFALRRDVLPGDPAHAGEAGLHAGHVILRPGKRPRPIVLRVNQGDCLEITLTNLLDPHNIPLPPGVPPTAPATREVSLHVEGLEVVDRIEDDGSWVGLNPDGLAAHAAANGATVPEQTRTYRLFAREEGVFLLFSQAASFGGNGGQIMPGLFGAVVVEPRGSKWYRSQVTEEVLDGATREKRDGLPILDYEKDGKDGRPLLAMTKARRRPHAGAPEVVDLEHSDLTAVIAGPDHGRFPPNPADDRDNAMYPDRDAPYREFTILYHDAIDLQPAFDTGNTPLNNVIGSGSEAFAINYGSVAIATEVLASRLGVGPTARAVDAKFEEFFLSSWACGDPALVVDVPANTPATPAAPAPAAGAAPPAPAAHHDGDRPGCSPRVPTPIGNLSKRPATRAFYPDDPSNVYHSYLNDRVLFRVLHAGTNIVHVHHQHAHQWLRTPASAMSKLLDSQTITPGDGFTLEMIYGSGNRNLTPGDSIFHCHFYPHFAAGLWAMWRVHDVFEAGTHLEDGRPAKDARALPDGEIALGTPIPGLVPMPTLPIAPAPAAVKVVPVLEPAADGSTGTAIAGYRAELADPDNDRGKNPGYPFFVPGVGGQRAPQPPMDFAVDESDPKAELLDGGLPRHVVLGGKTVYEKHNVLDFSREFITRGADGKVTDGFLVAQGLPDAGTADEQAAMAYHEEREHPTITPEGHPASFLTNGGHRERGAPYANPGVNPRHERERDQAEKAEAPAALRERVRAFALRDPKQKAVVRYKVADLQLDVVFNKKGWHYPQQRMASLWGDVSDLLSGARAPEPLFLRANTLQVVEFWLTNLIPSYYELDDFQVRTPTDLIGQHIHLVKFDVTSSDGAANGYNYQDGSFSPQEVRDRIDAINAGPGLLEHVGGAGKKLAAKATPFFGAGKDNAWLGAQTTVQRWYADRLPDPTPDVGARGRAFRGPGGDEPDRTLETVFTHDHLSPSTHQQVGLYAGLIVEPTGTRWEDVHDGSVMGHRLAAAIAPGGPPTRDGGPTSWQANIIPEDPRDAGKAIREFNLEFQDFQLAYTKASIPEAKPYVRYASPNAPAPWGWADPTHAIAPPGSGTATTPGLISGPPEPGARSLNYRSEPIPFRAAAPATVAAPLPDDRDPAHAFRSIPRPSDPELNVQPTGPIAPGSPFHYPGPFAGAGGTDPYTPLIRAYENDRVVIRALVGAHHNGHVFNLQGLKWLTEPSFHDSGFRANQVMSISEHFEMFFTVPAGASAGPGRPADYLYQASADTDGVAQGLWGLIRAYRGPTPDLQPLPRNAPSPSGARRHALEAFFKNDGHHRGPERHHRVVATSLARALPAEKAGLIYNASPGRVLSDPNALIYVRAEDLDKDGKFLPDAPAPEPLVLRANAGDLIRVTLRNDFDPAQAVFNQANPYQAGALAFGKPTAPRGAVSTEVGLHPQLLAYDVADSNGFNVGRNPVQTVDQGAEKTYHWYAGDLKFAGDELVATPIEFGTINLTPADPTFQHPHGLVGVLVVEPESSLWSGEDRATAAITPTRPAPGTAGPVPPAFNEFVLVAQDGVTNAYTPAGPGANLKSVNYKNESMISRYNFPAGTNVGGALGKLDVAEALADTLVPAPSAAASFNPVGVDPQTPLLLANPGRPVRVRLVHTGGTSYGSWAIHGHGWQRMPYQTGSGSLVQGYNRHSQWVGNTGPFGPLDQVDVLLAGAGGQFGVPGDYLYRSALAADIQAGQWGILRVTPGAEAVSLRELNLNADELTVGGRLLPVPPARRTSDAVTLYDADKAVATAKVDPRTGAFTISGKVTLAANAALRVGSAGGASAPIALKGTAPAPAQAIVGAAPAVTPPAFEPAQQRMDRFLRKNPDVR